MYHPTKFPREAWRDNMLRNLCIYMNLDQNLREEEYTQIYEHIDLNESIDS